MFFRVAPLAERDQKLWVDLPDIAAFGVPAMMDMEDRSVCEAASAFISVSI